MLLLTEVGTGKTQVLIFVGQVHADGSPLLEKCCPSGLPFSTIYPRPLDWQGYPKIPIQVWKQYRYSKSKYGDKNHSSIAMT